MGSTLKWTLKRDDAGYWYWERGNEESPIFCVQELAKRWMKSWKAVHEAKDSKDE